MNPPFALSERLFSANEPQRAAGSTRLAPAPTQSPSRGKVGHETGWRWQGEEALTFTIQSLLPDGRVGVNQFEVPLSDSYESAFMAFSGDVAIATPQGDVPIRHLMPGERVHTLEFGPARVEWISSVRIVPYDQAAKGWPLELIQVMPDAFGYGRPSTGGLLGPHARLLRKVPGAVKAWDRALFPVGALVDGENIVPVVPDKELRLFHISLAQHATITVNGMEAETYHPGPERLACLGDSGRALFFKMFPHVHTARQFGPLAHPRHDT